MANYPYDPQFASLPRQTEQPLSQPEDEAVEHLSPEAIRVLLHESLLYQEELQLQNEALRRAKQAAEAERDRYAELYNSAPVGFLTVDRQGIIRDANRSAQLLLMGNAHDISGLALGDFVALDDRDAFSVFMHQLFRSEQRQESLRMQRFSEVSWVAQFQARVVTAGPWAGEICRLALSDVSAQHQAAALRDPCDWLDVTLSSMGDALITTDARGNITFLNHAAVEFTGWPASAALGRDLDTVWGLNDERTGQPAGELARQVHQPEGARGSALHMVLTAPDNPERVVAACAAAMSSAVGPPQGMVIVFRDISEQRRMEARLRQTQKMEALGALAGGIAHDFNNILTAILGYTHMTGRALDTGNPVQSHLKEVRAAALRAKELVQHILTFTRQNPVEHHMVSIYETMQETLSLLRATIPATISIELYLDPGAGMVLAQAEHLHQVLMNLCANAEHAMRPYGGLLRIGLDVTEIDAAFANRQPALEPGLHIRLTVEDTGPGIPPEVLPHIFEPYYTTKAAGEGSGLGLAIVDGIVTSYQGAITVDSAPGAGTTFTVYLPRAANEAPPEPLDPDPPVIAGGKGERILLVEDEEPVAIATEMQLTELGYEVVAHLSSSTALDAFRADPQQFDLVLTDQTMPSMTGEEFARILHAIRPDLPIILVTGFSHLVDAEKAQALGINAFLNKPWDVQDMADALRRALRRERS